MPAEIPTNMRITIVCKSIISEVEIEGELEFCRQGKSIYYTPAPISSHEITE